MENCGDLKGELEKEVSYKKRYFISELLFFLSSIGVYFFIALLFLSSVVRFSIFHVLLFYSFMIFTVTLYMFIKPSKIETFQYSLKELANNLSVNTNKKRNLFRKVFLVLNSLSSIGTFGYGKKILETTRNYFSFILAPLIYSKNERLLKDIKEGLNKIASSSDFHSIHESLLLLNGKIRNYKEFKNLVVVYKSLKGANTADPFEFLERILENDKPKKWYVTVWYFLDKYGLIKLLLYTIIITVAGIILNYFGLLDWVIKLISSAIDFKS